MARRRKRNEFKIAELIVALGGFGLLLLYLRVGPQNFTSAVKSIGAIAVVAVGTFVLLSFAVLAVLIFRKKLGKQDDTANTISPQVQAPNRDALGTAENATIKPPLDSRSAFIENLRRIDWFQFEKLVGLAYECLGFAVTARGGANPDGGVDLVIERDGQQTAVQCKQWKTWNVGVKPVREFLGALADAKISRGIFITLNGYTADAKQLAEKHGIQILNETSLADMLLGLNLHENPRAQEILNDTRKFCPKCNRIMVKRTAEKGPNPGQHFWGCSGYPKCRFTMAMADSM
jgi:hypothetical protein